MKSGYYDTFLCACRPLAEAFALHADVITQQGTEDKILFRAEVVVKGG